MLLSHWAPLWFRMTLHDSRCGERPHMPPTGRLRCFFLAERQQLHVSLRSGR
jgi:hypothetical protein